MSQDFFSEIAQIISQVFLLRGDGEIAHGWRYVMFHDTSNLGQATTSKLVFCWFIQRNITALPWSQQKVDRSQAEMAGISHLLDGSPAHTRLFNQTERFFSTGKGWFEVIRTSGRRTGEPLGSRPLLSCIKPVSSSPFPANQTRIRDTKGNVAVVETLASPAPLSGRIVVRREAKPTPRVHKSYARR